MRISRPLDITFIAVIVFIGVTSALFWTRSHMLGHLVNVVAAVGVLLYRLWLKRTRKLR